MQPVVKPVDRSRQVGIRVQLRHQHGDGRFDIAASIMRLSSDLSRLDSVEPQRVVQTPWFLADKQGIGVDDARPGRRVGDSHAAKFGGEQPAIESCDVVAGEVTIRQSCRNGWGLVARTSAQTPPPHR